jgi:hypothetical protein
MKKNYFPTFSFLFRWDGTVDRLPYLLTGLIGCALKYNLDRLVANTMYEKRWDLFDYLVLPGSTLEDLSTRNPQLLLTLLAFSLPFVWVGVVMTLRRLRSAGLPLPLVFFFFTPLLNLLFFLLLSLLPPLKRPKEVTGRPTGFFERCFDRLIPGGNRESALLAAVSAAVLGGAAALLSVSYFQTYGFTLFVATPFGMGLWAALIYGFRKSRSLMECVSVAGLSCFILGLGFLAFAFEGIICLIMAMPLALALSALGGMVGYVIQRRTTRSTAGMAALLLFLPIILGMEEIQPPTPPVFEVRSSVDIQAPPKKVWKNVVAFTEIPPPHELLFKVGVAYPIRAEITGKGPGAVRHCVFSTGPFVEPIQVWDEPRLLKFSVTDNPAPMEEWTPYHAIHPPHLHGFLISNGGQFRLIPLPNGGTRLEGTTWYLHHMWPASYWRVWSDEIIHEIHMRVLNHIKMESEAKS